MRLRRQLRRSERFWARESRQPRRLRSRRIGRADHFTIAHLLVPAAPVRSPPRAGLLYDAHRMARNIPRRGFSARREAPRHIFRPSSRQSLGVIALRFECWGFRLQRDIPNLERLLRCLIWFALVVDQSSNRSRYRQVASTPYPPE